MSDSPTDTDDDTDTADQAHRTWWERHAIQVMGGFSLVMLIFVITFQMSC